jgi:hypothetical protein
MCLCSDLLHVWLLSKWLPRGIATTMSHMPKLFFQKPFTFLTVLYPPHMATIHRRHLYNPRLWLAGWLSVAVAHGFILHEHQHFSSTNSFVVLKCHAPLRCASYKHYTWTVSLYCVDCLMLAMLNFSYVRAPQFSSMVFDHGSYHKKHVITVKLRHRGSCNSGDTKVMKRGRMKYFQQKLNLFPTWTWRKICN